MVDKIEEEKPNALNLWYYCMYFKIVCTKFNMFEIQIIEVWEKNQGVVFSSEEKKK